MFRPGNLARKIQGGPGGDTKLIIKGRRERRTGEWHVARMPPRPVHRLPSSMPIFVTHGLRNFGLAGGHRWRCCRSSSATRTPRPTPGARAGVATLPRLATSPPTAMPRRSQIAASIKSRDAQDPVPILVTGRLARRADCPGPAAPAARRPPPRTGVPRRPQAHPRGGHRRPVPGHRPGTAVLRRTAELLEQSTSAWLTRTQPLWPRSTTHEPGHRSGPRSRRLRGAHRRAHLAQTPARSPAKYLAALVEWGYQPAEATWVWRLDKGQRLSARAHRAGAAARVNTTGYCSDLGRPWGDGSAGRDS